MEEKNDKHYPDVDVVSRVSSDPSARVDQTHRKLKVLKPITVSLQLALTLRVEGRHIQLIGIGSWSPALFQTPGLISS